VSSQPLTIKRLATLVAGLFILVGLSWYRLSQQLPGDWEVIYGETMGTTYTVKVPTVYARGLRVEVDGILEEVNASMSTYRPDSELSKFNAAGSESFVLSESVFGVMQDALSLSEMTDGAFDITVGPIVNAYGFGPDIKIELPDEDELKALREGIGFGHLTLDEGHSSIQKDLSEVYCDLSAIAKGYGIDRVAQLLESKGIEQYFVEIGGEVRCRGVNQDGVAWRVGIEKPVSDMRELHRVISLSDLSMATSGSYRNYVEVNGTRVSHTIDPRTARPVTHDLVSVTVIHESCEWADGYATALMVMGEIDALTFAESKALAVLLIVSGVDGELHEVMSSAFEALELENESDQTNE
jgi:FAD:protein FMN transferase